MGLALCFTLPREESIASLEHLRYQRKRSGRWRKKRGFEEERESRVDNGGEDKSGFRWL